MPWIQSPTLPSLAPQRLAVWRMRPELYYHELAKYWHYLNPTERQRAERYRFPNDTQAFIVTRGILRWLLAQYLGQAPHKVLLQPNSYGKLATSEPALKFNLSHSGAWAVLALTLDAELGIDIELVRDHPNHLELANKFFTAQEATALRNFPQDQQQLAFLHCWVRKEAVIKAYGHGLFMSLAHFTVEISLKTTGPLAFQNLTAAPSFPQLTLQAFNPGENYVGALAVAKPGFFETAYYELVPSDS